MKIQVDTDRDVSQDGFNSSIGIVSQVDNRRSPFKVAYEISSLTPNWIQIASLSDQIINIKKSEVIAKLHPRSDFNIKEASNFDRQEEKKVQDKNIKYTIIQDKEQVQEQKDKDMQETFVRLIRGKGKSEDK